MSYDKDSYFERGVAQSTESENCEDDNLHEILELLAEADTEIKGLKEKISEKIWDWA